jgi:hypothetical protein
MRKLLLILVAAIALAIPVAGYFDGNGARAATLQNVVEDGGGHLALCDPGSSRVLYLNVTPYGSFTAQRFECRYLLGFRVWSSYYQAWFQAWTYFGYDNDYFYGWYPVDCWCIKGA